MMNVIKKIQSTGGKTAFSFELLPPLKGNGLENVYYTIDTLREFDPQYINITTHRSELVYREKGDGSLEQIAHRHRPGTVAIAAAIQHKYNIPVVPHIICSGFTKEETEYALIDLQILGINNLLLLRGDKGKHEETYTPTGHYYATDLQKQVNTFNQGVFLDGTKMNSDVQPFSYGMACYPEKHSEAPDLMSDLRYAKMKVDAGAEYLVTQMFFDNQKYYDFVEKCREMHSYLYPFHHHQIFQRYSLESINRLQTDEEAVEVGLRVPSAKDLIAHGVPSIHFYSLMATESVKRVAQAVY